MLNNCPSNQPGDGHTSPCPWSKAIMWLLAILITMGAWTLGGVSSRVTITEKQGGDLRENMAAMRASMDYMARDLSDIKATLRRDEVSRKTP